MIECCHGLIIARCSVSYVLLLKQIDSRVFRESYDDCEQYVMFQY